jgi:VanZ family protein
MIGMHSRTKPLSPPWRFLPAVAYYGFIFFLSSRSSFPVESPFSGFDKLAHVGIYGLFGALLAWSLADRRDGLGTMRMALAFLIGAAGGALDEVHQIFVPGRSAEVWDAVADAAGVAAGLFLFNRIGRARRRPQKKS